MCDNESSNTQSPEEVEEAVEEMVEAEAELATNQSEDSSVGVPKSEAASQEGCSPSDCADSDAPHSPEQENVSDPPSEEAKPRPAPVPAPRASFCSTEKCPLVTTEEKQEETKTPSLDEEAADSGDDSCPDNPPGFLYKVHSSRICF